MLVPIDPTPHSSPAPSHVDRPMLRRLRRTLGGLALAACTAAAATPAHAEAYHFRVVVQPGATTSTLGGINNAGLAAGTAVWADADFGLVPPFVTGFLHDSVSGGFVDVAPPEGMLLAAFAVNDMQSVVGAVFLDLSSPDTLGFVQDAGGITMFAYPGRKVTRPRGIGRSGLVTGFAPQTGEEPWVGFIYDPVADSFTDIGFAGGSRVFPQGMNAAGTVVGSVVLEADAAFAGSPSGGYAFVRRSDGTATLFQVDGLSTSARGINDRGQVTGFFREADGRLRNFVVPTPRDPGYVSFENDPSLVFDAPNNGTAQSINDAGRIVGFGVGDDGIERAFVATPIATDKDDCKAGTWRDRVRADGSSFDNQGQCLAFVITGG